jgi:hypothetical protein
VRDVVSHSALQVGPPIGLNSKCPNDGRSVACCKNRLNRSKLCGRTESGWFAPDGGDATASRKGIRRAGVCGEVAIVPREASHLPRRPCELLRASPIARDRPG